MSASGLDTDNVVAASDVLDPEDNGALESNVVQIRILTAGGTAFPQIKAILDTNIPPFEETKGGRVKVNVDEVDDLVALAEEVRFNADQDEGYYDGFLTNPGQVGTAVQAGGFYDLSDFVQESTELDWADVLLAFREAISSYDGRIYMLPLDGDVHSMFYRRDVLDHFGLKIPRTWDEYTDVAKAVHGQTFRNQTLIGSCIGRKERTTGGYYANLVLASWRLRARRRHVVGAAEAQEVAVAALGGKGMGRGKGQGWKGKGR